MSWCVKDAMTVKKTKDYKWGNELGRTLRIFGLDTSYPDVLTPYEGAWMKHTGVCCFGIQIPEEDIMPFPGDVELEII